MSGNPLFLVPARTACVCLFAALQACSVSPVEPSELAPEQDGSAVNAHAGTNPLLSEYSERLTLQKAETNYRARRLDTALEQYGMVAAMDNHPFAWLRIGNICHRRGDVSGAFDAYRRARQAASGEARFGEIRSRAVMNLALLGLDQAQVALEDLGLAGRKRSSGQWVQEIRLRLDELNSSLDEPGVRSGPALVAPLVSAAANAGRQRAEQTAESLR